MLQSSFNVGNEGSVVSEEEVAEQLLKCFCVGMQSPAVKQTAVKTVADIYSTAIVKVLYVLFKHFAEKDAEQSLCKNTTSSHSVDDGEESRDVAVHPKMTTLVFVRLDNHAEEFRGQPMCSMIIHSPFLLTMSKALFRSTNATYCPLFCSLHSSSNCLRTNTMSVVLLLALNPY